MIIAFPKARKRAKKDMKNATTEFERSVQNGRQVSPDTILYQVPKLLLLTSLYSIWVTACIEGVRQLCLWIYRGCRGPVAMPSHRIVCDVLWTIPVGENQGVRGRQVHYRQRI
jgi:hypothetical protein